jgi:hypothetical protein
MESLKIFIKTEEGEKEEEKKDIETQFLLEETYGPEPYNSEGYVHIYLNLRKKKNLVPYACCDISTLLILDKFIRVPDSVFRIRDILEWSPYLRIRTSDLRIQIWLWILLFSSVKDHL